MKKKKSKWNFKKEELQPRCCVRSLFDCKSVFTKQHYFLSYVVLSMYKFV